MKSVTKAERCPVACYNNQAKRILENNFPRISCAAIDAVLRSSGSNFANAFRRLFEIEAHRVEIVSTRPKDGGVGRFPDDIPEHLKVFIKSKRRIDNFQLTSKQLIDEIDLIPELNTKKPNPSFDVKVEETGNGAEIECGCCFGDYPLSEMRECTVGSGHFVCKQCIYLYVSEQLDGNDKAEFSCIVDADCQHKYSMALLDHTLTPKLKGRAADRVFREEIKKAGIPHW